MKVAVCVCVASAASAYAGWNIIRSIEQTNDLTQFFTHLSTEKLQDLETNEVVAGTFICDIVNGDVAGAADLVGSEIVTALADDWNTIVNFVENIPELAEDAFNDIVNGVEEGVSIIGEIFTNPGGAISAIESIGGDIVSDVESVFDGTGCDLGLGGCPSSMPGIAAQVSSSCSALLAISSYASSPASVYASTTMAYSTSAYSATPTSYLSLSQPSATSVFPSQVSAGAEAGSDSNRARTFEAELVSAISFVLALAVGLVVF